MQTFLPYPSFAHSAEVLDMRRLGKQRVETWQIIQALTTPGYGWQSHPAVTMWRGHIGALARYGVAICDEWIDRRYKDTLRQRFLDVLSRKDNDIKPSWFGDSEFHLSHQSNLVRKDPGFYAPLFPGVPSDLPYVWPSVIERITT